MIISRKEFHKRMGTFSKSTIIEEKDEIMSVEKLYKEIVADAPFRNHNYMFNKDIDWKKLELQEDTVNIKNKFPNIKTEGQRYEKIKEEIINDTYKAVPVLRDADYPDVIYVDDGFHRIYIAHELGHKVIRIRAKYGKYVLEKSITFKDLVKLLDMLVGLFKKEHNSLTSLRDFLKMVLKKKPEIGETYSISYSSCKEESR